MPRTQEATTAMMYAEPTTHEHPRTAGQRIIDTFDVLCLILDRVHDRPSLARLARSHTAFFDLCTKRIWASVDSLRPLVALLPKHALPVSLWPFSLVESKLSNDGLCDEDLIRWRIYSPLVKAISLDFCLLGNHAPLRHFWQFKTTHSARLNELNLDVLSAILQLRARQGGSILPNLRQAVLKSYTPTVCDTARALGDTNVTRLCIHKLGFSGNEPEDERSEYSAFHLVAEWRQLKEISILGNEGTIGARATLISTLDPEVSHIESFEVLCKIARSRGLLIALSKLDLLQKLVIDDTSQNWPAKMLDDGVLCHAYWRPLSDFLNSHEVKDILGRNSFARLQNLTMASTLEFCAAMVTAVGSQLTSLKIATTLPTTQDLQALLGAIVRPKGDTNKVLKHLSLIIRDNKGSFCDSCWCMLYALRHLDLHSFHLEGRYERDCNDYDLADDVVSRLIFEWPNLSLLHLEIVRQDGWTVYPNFVRRYRA
ncbi:hypothetical protein CALVIDRAFT_537635 [Calocera viscosa TUFC12733]|uniref:F-box domain-containing protein n=1 Tax=Calocera viscosa (strain TUFC12733) TaxID=1330018 RepID=A0A167LUR4_CALVF|nr:hypothetical protein CALVIDRAFT_537635 [Calocera viscosa TUFC12733]